MKETKSIFITDCEGPISKNDNAFELTQHFIPDGEKFFAQISKYDDILADIVKRNGYKAGDTLKLIVPFLKAYNVTNKKMMEFSAQNILLMPGAKKVLQFLKDMIPCFIISTSYEHYIRILCHALDFPYKNTYCTALNIDAYSISRGEQKRFKQFSREICATSLIEIPEGATSLQDFSQRDRQTIKCLNEIFWKKIMQMKSCIMIKEVNPIGGIEKANATRNIADKTGKSLNSVIYVGDSITDVECFRLVKENGGVTISFNGNAYAVREAEIAVLSTNAIVIAIIADVFERFGREAVFNLVDDWGYTGLKRYDIDPRLQRSLQKTFPKMLPKMTRINMQNIKEISIESSAFRKFVRGKKIGKLG